MSLYYGTVPPPTQFALGLLAPLGLTVEPERDESTSLPSYVANGITSTGDDKITLHAIISLHTFGSTIAEADQWAWAAHYKIIGTTLGDIITLPNGDTAQCAGLGPEVAQIPVFQPYRDAFIKRYYARYCIPFRYS